MSPTSRSYSVPWVASSTVQTAPIMDSNCRYWSSKTMDRSFWTIRGQLACVARAGIGFSLRFYFTVLVDRGCGGVTKISDRSEFRTQTGKLKIAMELRLHLHPSALPLVGELVLDDAEQRDIVGVRRVGVELSPTSGRNGAAGD